MSKEYAGCESCATCQYRFQVDYADIHRTCSLVRNYHVRGIPPFSDRFDYGPSYNYIRDMSVLTKEEKREQDRNKQVEDKNTQQRIKDLENEIRELKASIKAEPIKKVKPIKEEDEENQSSKDWMMGCVMSKY
jgi:hypothetical protein